MKKNWFDSGRLAAAILAGAALVACGGGGDIAESSTQSVPVLKVEARVQPADMQEAGAIQSRSLTGGARAQAVELRLGTLNLSKSAVLQDPGVRLIGLARPLAAARSPEAMAGLLHWQATRAGGQVAALSVSAQGAYGLRMGLRVDTLPSNATLRVYSQGRPEAVYEISGQQILQTIARNLEAGDAEDAARTWWTPETGSPEQTLEIELPAGTDPSALRVSLPQVSHIFEDLSLPTEGALETKINESDTCNLDATCYDELAAQRDSVARMLFSKDGNTYVCTGTLLNDVAGSGTPYFLSANHCISTQSAAASLQTDWFYRSPTCNSRTLSAASTRRLGGATLLYASAATDMTLLRLNEAPPTGARFAAWDASAQPMGLSVFGLHHPQADLLKVSLGNVTNLTSCSSSSDNFFNCDGTSGNYYRVALSSGTSQGGSSGSALFSLGSKYVIGTLYGGVTSCSATGTFDIYGRFDVAYNDGIKKWLAGNSGGDGGGASGGASTFGNLFRTILGPK
ncbi:MAG: trypsin-like peptidase domain-containing protein [Simplicispira suum]|uniref:trypsin-like peptidase domain-containing protein n=1 Tax=Simplicispira suum TaxID=2109915 RepID=UPI001C6CB394|nr:trypsin-like peptidase domain-containing protein [Simplicispira suum]MBW7832932.1 trypsin-like peptidase domain-containing protein [Simplicispira suum]